jgi:hypothetical protein
MDNESYSYTRNIKLAAFLRLRSIHPDNVQKLGRGKAMYGYSRSSVTPDAWDKLKSEFDKSEFITYAQCLDAILDLAF